MANFVDPHAPAIGSIVGGWLLLGRIDSGSYGVVYRARRADDPQAPPVALKMAKNPGDPRFEREAELLRLVQHPAVPCSSGSSRSSSERPSTGSGRGAERGGVPAWLSSGLAALVGSMLVGVCTDVRHREPALQEDWSVAEEWHPPPIETPDAGVVEEALASVEQSPKASSAANGLALPMPKTPQPGQKKPPCDPGYELVALGACWLVSEKKPPCGAGGHEYDGKCVRASFEAPRMPTSGDPR